MSAHTPHELQDEFPHDVLILAQLKAESGHFRSLAERYHALNRSIHRIEVEVEHASDTYLTQLRKQRLRLLDDIAVIIEDVESKGAVLPDATPTPPAAGLFGRGDTVPA